MTAEKTQRYHLIDALRGFALLDMIIFHFFYDFFVIYGGDFRWATTPWIVVWERTGCALFIVISGVSLNFTDRGIRNGIKLNLLGFLITAITVIAIREQAIYFGVLNFLGCAMLLCQAAKPLLNRLNPFIGTVGCFVLYAFTYGVPTGNVGVFDTPLATLPKGLYAFRVLSFFGFPDKGFFSSDYFPLIPWIFLFVCGYFVWRVIKSLNIDHLFRFKIPPLCFLGRHTLIIYIIHQPLLMGICALIFG